MADIYERVFFRDKFVSGSDANLSITSSPLLYGLSIYTVLGAHVNKNDGKLYFFRPKDHYDRLVDSCKIVDFNTFTRVWDFKRFETTIKELLRQNKVKQDALARVTVFIDEIMSGTKTHDLKTSLYAYTYPLTEFLPLSGVNLCVSSWMRTPDNAIPSRAKVSGSYVNSALMKNEALLNGYDDAISLDENGHVCESTVSNIFIVKDGVVVTPGGFSHLLEGITRDSVIKLCDKLGIKHERRNLDRSELYLSDEIFLSGSSVRITPVLSVDKRPIGNGRPGTITQLLFEEYEKIQNGSSKYYAEWLAAV